MELLRNLLKGKYKTIYWIACHIHITYACKIGLPVLTCNPWLKTNFFSVFEQTHIFTRVYLDLRPSCWFVVCMYVCMHACLKMGLLLKVGRGVKVPLRRRKIMHKTEKNGTIRTMMLQYWYTTLAFGYFFSETKKSLKYFRINVCEMNAITKKIMKCIKISIQKDFQSFSICAVTLWIC